MEGSWLELAVPIEGAPTTGAKGTPFAISLGLHPD